MPRWSLFKSQVFAGRPRQGARARIQDTSMPFASVLKTSKPRGPTPWPRSRQTSMLLISGKNWGFLTTLLCTNGGTQYICLEGNRQQINITHPSSCLLLMPRKLLTVNHGKLFGDTLRILAYWCTHQTSGVRWSPSHLGSTMVPITSCMQMILWFLAHVGLVSSSSFLHVLSVSWNVMKIQCQ